MVGHVTGDCRDKRRCPTCKATRNADADSCHRCRADLRAINEVERQAASLELQARHCYARGWYRQAAALAQQAVALENTPGRRKLLACSQIIGGDFDGGWKTYLSTRS